MNHKHQTMSFREQMAQSLADLQSIVERRESASGNGRFSARLLEVAAPSAYGATGIRRLRRSLGVSQAVFAQMLGVSAALVRAWELGTRTPSPLARRLLDQVRAHPQTFILLLRPARQDSSRARSANARWVA